ncbi:MAG: hypothetical protein JXQ73_11545 [Phycisphaerae bacterium]|nr:hypothetical protein [Phycisphaerae bacterium]
MSRRGDCWDNAVAESFFVTFKMDSLCEIRLQTRSATRTAETPTPGPAPPPAAERNLLSVWFLIL